MLSGAGNNNDNDNDNGDNGKKKYFYYERHKIICLCPNFISEKQSKTIKTF